MQLGTTNSASKSSGAQYLNFLEKQVEKSQKVFQDVSIVQEAVNDIGQRVDLLELGQQDLIKKFRILESIAMGSNDDQLAYKKTIDNIYLRVQDIEARLSLTQQQQQYSQQLVAQTLAQERMDQHQTRSFQQQEKSDVNLLSQKLDLSLEQMERRINEILTKDFDQFLSLRENAFEQKIISLIDSQAKDIAFDFTNLDAKLNELQEFVETNRLATTQSENRDPNIKQSNIEKALIVRIIEQFKQDIKREVLDKADYKDLEKTQRQFINEIKELEKKIKVLNKPQQSLDKDLKALENRFTMKLTKAIQRLGDIMKKQDRKIRGMIETSESRLQKQYSPLSNKSSRNRVFKSQHSLNMSNTSMMRSLSPIKQENSKHEQSIKKSVKKQPQILDKGQEYQSIATNESAFRKYQSQFKSETSQASQKKYIRSGIKRENRESATSLSPNTQNAYKRTISQERNNDNESTQAKRQNQDQSINKEKSQPLRRRDTDKSNSVTRVQKKDKSNKGKDSKARTLENQSSKQQTMNVRSSVNEFDTVIIQFLYLLQPNFDLKQNQQSPQTFQGDEDNSIRKRYLNNLKEASTISNANDSRLMSSNQKAMNTSIDRTTQLKITNERLAKLEKMYEELSQLEEKAKNNN